MDKKISAPWGDRVRLEFCSEVAIGLKLLVIFLMAANEYQEKNGPEK
jgi:hypothetical protein